MATYIVTTLNDLGTDATSAGSLSADQSDGGGLSLREALTLANSTGVADTISFDASLNGSTIVLTNGELQISSDISLDGDVDGDDRADITLDGNGTSRVLHVFNSGTDALLQSLRITNGSAFYGGGIYLRRATLTVEDSTIDGNFANIHGGAISAKLAGPTLNLLNTNISNNTTNNGGGGVHGQFATIHAVNTTIVGNSAPSNGGAIRAESSTVTLTNSTLTGNSANLGSAVYGINSPIDLINTIALGNYDTFSSPSIEPQFRAVSGSTLTQTDSVTTGDATTVFAATTTVGTATAGVAGYYGGSVETIALLQDASNPALDIGRAPAGLTTDTLGNDRDVDLAGVANGGTVDAGAVELTGLPETASLIVTIIDDIVDQFDGETSLREAINFVNTGMLTGTITFASGTGEAFENDATIALTEGELSLIAAVIIDGDHDSDGVADVTIDAQDSSRVFSVSTTGAKMSGLNITNGYTSGGDNGAGIYVASGAELTLSNSTVTNSDATGGTSSLTGIGGGIGNFGTLTVENS